MAQPKSRTSCFFYACCDLETLTLPQGCLEYILESQLRYSESSTSDRLACRHVGDCTQWHCLSAARLHQPEGGGSMQSEDCCSIWLLGAIE